MNEQAFSKATRGIWVSLWDSSLTGKTDAIYRCGLSSMWDQVLQKSRGTNSDGSHGSYPHQRKSFSSKKVPAAIFRGNVLGNWLGVTQVRKEARESEKSNPS